MESYINLEDDLKTIYSKEYYSNLILTFTNEQILLYINIYMTLS